MSASPDRRDAFSGVTGKRDARRNVQKSPHKTSKPKAVYNSRKPLVAITNAEALAKWHTIAGDLETHGYGDAAFETLNQYIEAFQDWLETSPMINAKNRVVKGNQGPVENPFITIRNEAINRMREAEKLLPLKDGVVKPQSMTAEEFFYVD